MAVIIDSLPLQNPASIPLLPRPRNIGLLFLRRQDFENRRRRTACEFASYDHNTSHAVVRSTDAESAVMTT
jgi:hypothetical protein